MRGAKQKEMLEISDLTRREILHLKSVRVFDWYFQRRPGLFFRVQNFEFQFFGGVFRKLNIFGL